jgi:phosphoenolpyruvate synthase/pyruvate phosphate dikinase
MEDYDLIIDLDWFGEIILIQRTHIDKDNWEDEIQTIDEEKMNIFLAKHLNLNTEEMKEAEETVEILNIQELNNKTWDIVTTHGKVNVSYPELEDLL